MKRSVRNNKRRAFTLLEVLMVIIIIGLLAAFVVPQFFNLEGGQKIKLTEAKVKTGLNGAINLFRTAMGRFPTSDEGLKALIEPPSDEAEAKKWRDGGGPWLKAEDLKDAWEAELRYESPGQVNTDYDLSSSGPDKQFGTDDDITNFRSTR